MKIYVAHSTSYDFKKILYQPIIDSKLYNEHQIILPHLSDQWVNSKEIIKTCELVIAEVSYPSTGLGIELGWASDANIKIICLYQQETNYSKSLTAVSNQFLSYSSSADLINQLSKVVNQSFPA